MINNLRDIPSDAAAGKRTLAVRIGDHRTRVLYGGCLLIPFGMLAVIAFARPLALLALATLPLALPPLRAVRAGAQGPALIGALGQTGRLQLAFGAAAHHRPRGHHLTRRGKRARPPGGGWGTCSSMTERYPLRPITPDEFDAYCEVPIQAFNDSDASAEINEHERLVFEFDRSIAAFDGDAMVGTTAAYSFQLTVPGGITGAAGVTFVAVLPSHRRRGHPVGDDAPPARRHRRPGRGGRGAVRVRDGHLRTVRLRLCVLAAEPDDPPRRGRAEPGRDRQHGSGRRRGGRRGHRPRPGAAAGRAAGRAARRAGQGLRRGGPAPARDDGQGRTLVAVRPRRRASSGGGA